MTGRALISSLSPELDGKRVRIEGWISDIRDLAKVKFVIIRDFSGVQQCIAKKGVTPDVLFDDVPKLLRESVVEIEGVLSANKTAKKGVELVIESLNVLSESAAPLPVDTSAKSLTHEHKRLDFRFLDTRRPQINAIFKVRSRIQHAIVDFFTNEKFTQITTPKLTAAGVESGAEMFEVKYFDKKAFLSQSPQLYKQMFVVGGFERVFEIGAVYRAEKSRTPRHLSEFTGVDFEIGFIKDHHDVMDIIERMLKFVIASVRDNCTSELAELGVSVVVPDKIPRLDIADIKKLLKAKNKSVPDNEDLDSEGEKILGEIVKEKFGCDFVFCLNYPWAKRPFYHMRPDGDEHGTKSFDLLWGGVEVATGAQREHRYDVLKQQAKEKGVDLDAMGFYADIFRFGVPAHGGVGFGLDRFVQRLLNLPDVREAILLPRDTERLTP